MKNRPAKNLSQLEINQSPSTKMIKYKADSFLNTQCSHDIALVTK